MPEIPQLWGRPKLCSMAYNRTKAIEVRGWREKAQDRPDCSKIFTWSGQGLIAGLNALDDDDQENQEHLV